VNSKIVKVHINEKGEYFAVFLFSMNFLNKSDGLRDDLFLKMEKRELI